MRKRYIEEYGKVGKREILKMNENRGMDSRPFNSHPHRQCTDRASETNWIQNCIGTCRSCRNWREVRHYNPHSRCSCFQSGVCRTQSWCCSVCKPDAQPQVLPVTHPPPVLLHQRIKESARLSKTEQFSIVYDVQQNHLPISLYGRNSNSIVVGILIIHSNVHSSLLLDIKQKSSWVFAVWVDGRGVYSV